MRLLVIFVFFIYNFSFCQNYSDSGYIFGKILYDEELKIPVHGVRIDSDKSNAKDSDIKGQFELFFPNSKTPEKVRITVGNQINEEAIIEDARGNLYALVKPTTNELGNYEIPPQPELDSLHIYVLPAGQLAVDLKTINYNLQEYIEQLIKRTEQDRRKIEELLKLEPDNKKLANEVEQLNKDIQQNEAYLIKGLTAKEAYNLLLKQTENANSRLIHFLDALKQNEDIKSAIRILNPLKAYEESAISLDFAVKGIEEIKTYINTLSKDFGKRENVFEAYDLITNIYKENSVLIADDKRNYLVENLEVKRNFLIQGIEEFEFYDDLYFNEKNRFTDSLYAQQTEKTYESILAADQNSKYAKDYTFIWYLARACVFQDKYDKAIKYSLEALKIQDSIIAVGLDVSDFPKINAHKVTVNKQDFWKDYIRINHQVGTLQLALGNIEKAKKRFELTTKLTNNDPYDTFYSIQILDLIATHIVSGDFKKAKKIYYQLYKDINGKYETIEPHIELYDMDRRGLYQNLEVIYKGFINLNQSIKNKKGKVDYYSHLEPMLYSKIADAYRLQQNLEKADAYYTISNLKYKNDLSQPIVTSNGYAQVYILKEWAKNTITAAQMWATIEEFDKSKASYEAYITVLKTLSAIDKDIYSPKDFLVYHCLQVLSNTDFLTYQTTYFIPKTIGLDIIKMAEQKLSSAEISPDRRNNYSKRLNDYKAYFEQLDLKTYLKEYHYNKFYSETLGKENELHELKNQLTYKDAILKVNDIINGYEAYLSKYNNSEIRKNYAYFYFDVGTSYLMPDNTSYKLSADVCIKGHKLFPEDPFLLVYGAFAYLLNGDIDKALAIYNDHKNTTINIKKHKVLRTLFLEELLRLQNVERFKQLQPGGLYYKGFLEAKKILEL